MMKKFILGVIAAMISFASFAQEASSLYFLRHNPMRHQMNSAFRLDGYKTVIGFPSVNADVNLSQNIFKIKDLVKGDWEFRYDDAETLGELSPLWDRLRKNYKLNTKAEVSYLNFGFTNKNGAFWTAGIDMDFESFTKVPRTLFNTIIDLDDNLEEDGFNKESYSLESIKAKSLAYISLYVGWARNFGKFDFGGKFRLIADPFYLKSDFDNTKFFTGEYQWKLVSKEEAVWVSPIKMENDPDGGLTKADPDEGVSAKEYFKRFGKGMSIDLGACYHFTKRITFSAAINDFGFIRFKNASRMYTDIDYKFDPIDKTEPGEKLSWDVVKDNIDVAFEDFDEKIKGQYGIDNTPNASSTWLNSKILLAAQYDLTDKVTFGFLSNSAFAFGSMYQTYTLSANYMPNRMVDLALTFTNNQHRFNNIGAAFNFNLFPLNIYLAVDQIPITFSRSNERNPKLPNQIGSINYSVGVNWIFGFNKRRWDDDKDGVMNKRDKCPNTMPEEFEYVDKSGCVPDTDGDGVPDYKDECPDTPSEAIGFISEKGCPLDSDGDGVFDYLDKCPDTPKEAYGMVDSKGCPKDSDFDGVPDYLDKCPDTDLNLVGKIGEDGCALDSDGDGIPDYLDACPEIAGVASNNGCPEQKVKVEDDLELKADVLEEEKKKVEKLFQKALNGIEFETGKSVIKAKSFGILDEVVKVMKENPTYKLTINGHTDNTGSYDKNVQLSKDRAKSVKDYLVKKGVEDKRLESFGFGPDKPIADNKTPQGRAKNRRVEFVLSFIQTVEE